MRRELEQTLRNRNKAAVMQKLYQANPIDVPNALLESQIRDMQIEAMRRAGAKDVSQAPPREPLVEPARRRVALGLLFNHVIRRENLVLDPQPRERAVGRNGGRIRRCRRNEARLSAKPRRHAPGGESRTRGPGRGLDSRPC